MHGSMVTSKKSMAEMPQLLPLTAKLYASATSHISGIRKTPSFIYFFIHFYHLARQIFVHPFILMLIEHALSNRIHNLIGLLCRHFV